MTKLLDEEYYEARKKDQQNFTREIRQADINFKKEALKKARSSKSGGTMKNQKGITVLELVVVVMFIAVLLLIAIDNFGYIRGAASTVACAANIENFSTEVELLMLEPGDPPPTQEQVRKLIGWNDGKRNRYKDYWYLPNNSDFNKGHGNDLDNCDEENPGQSSKNRECFDFKFVIVCQHDGHTNESDAKYIFKTNFFVHQIVPYNEVPHVYLQDANWWLYQDPGFQKWIGRTPENNTK